MAPKSAIRFAMILTSLEEKNAHLLPKVAILDYAFFIDTKFAIDNVLVWSIINALTYGKTQRYVIQLL